jgi:HK97 family phage portal protein
VEAVRVSLFFARRPVETRAVDPAAFARGDDMTHLGEITPDRALRLAPVYAAVRLLSDSIASMPLQVFEEATGGVRRKVETPTLLARPDVTGTVYDWMHRCMSSLLLAGNAVALVGRDGSGRAVAARWQDPARCRPVDGPNGVEWYIDGRRVPQSVDLLHIPAFPRPDETWAMSPLTAYATTIHSGIMAAEFGRDWFRNGSVPSGVLESEQAVDKATADVIKERFREAAAQRSVVALGAGATYKPISVSPEESQFIETMRLTAAQIAHAYGIPPEMIGGDMGGSSLTYANVEQRAIQFVTFTLRPWMTRLEQAFSALLLPGQYARFNADALIRADTLTRYRAHTEAQNAGWRNRDETRALEELPPLPPGTGGDEYIRGVLYPASTLTEQV